MSDDKNILHTKDNKYHACVDNNNDTIRLYLNKLFKTNTTNGCIMCQVSVFCSYRRI